MFMDMKPVGSETDLLEALASCRRSLGSSPTPSPMMVAVGSLIVRITHLEGVRDLQSRLAAAASLHRSSQSQNGAFIQACHHQTKEAWEAISRPNPQTAGRPLRYFHVTMDGARERARNWDFTLNCVRFTALQESQIWMTRPCHDNVTTFKSLQSC